MWTAGGRPPSGPGRFCPQPRALRGRRSLLHDLGLLMPSTGRRASDAPGGDRPNRVSSFCLLRTVPHVGPTVEAARYTGARRLLREAFRGVLSPCEHPRRTPRSGYDHVSARPCVQEGSVRPST